MQKSAIVEAFETSRPLIISLSEFPRSDVYDALTASAGVTACPSDESKDITESPNVERRWKKPRGQTTPKTEKLRMMEEDQEKLKAELQEAHEQFGILYTKAREYAGDQHTTMMAEFTFRANQYREQIADRENLMKVDYDQRVQRAKVHYEEEKQMMH